MYQSVNSLVADITISHGHFVDETANIIGQPQPGWCDFCAITSYKLVQAEGEIEVTVLLASNDDHVLSKAL